MSKTPIDDSHNSDDKLLREYRFHSKNFNPNRFATRSRKQLLKVVVLERDI
ncbi:hypothetical protein [Microcoleus sp. LEGE 07076]|uniref:hypothetical protein n=1 Tax=Microcoleus sp. LEGE 07076 TaxID=915322 RepID=UPI0018813039|nr:hypothetical protein [Microcoleus sp. LEGE 07076]